MNGESGLRSPGSCLCSEHCLFVGKAAPLGAYCCMVWGYPDGRVHDGRLVEAAGNAIANIFVCHKRKETMNFPRIEKVSSMWI